MPETIQPCLWFDTLAEEAAHFYCSLFKDSEVTEVQRWPEGTERAGQALGVSFTLQGRPFTAINGGPEFTFTEAISMQVPCDSQEESDDLYDRLVDGGEPSQCGWLKDRYGLSWQVFPKELFTLLGQPDGTKAAAAQAAMMQQVKIDLGPIREAAERA